jgi:hypothetical protein
MCDNLCMGPKISFEVDLADLDSIKERLPELERIVGEKHRVAEDAAIEYAQWSDLLKRLRYLADDSPEDGSGRPRSVTRTASDMVVRMLDEAGGPLRAAQIGSRLPQINPGTLGWVLSTAAKEGRIKRLEHGLYAPADWGSSQPELLTGEEEDGLQD